MVGDSTAAYCHCQLLLPTATLFVLFQLFRFSFSTFQNRSRIRSCVHHQVQDAQAAYEAMSVRKDLRVVRDGLHFNG